MRLRHRDRPANATASPASGLTAGALRWRSAVAGCSAAAVSLLAIALPALLVWVASAESTVEWTSALSVGSSVWLLANGASLGSGSATISLVPWLLTAIPLVVATIAARRVLAQLDVDTRHRFTRLGGLRGDVADTGVAFIASYAAVGLLVAVATASHPLHASVMGSVLGATAVGALAVLVALALEFRSDIGSVAPDLGAALHARVPVNLRRALGPGLGGALSVFGAGLLLTVAVVVAQWIGSDTSMTPWAAIRSASAS